MTTGGTIALNRSNNDLAHAVATHSLGSTQPNEDEEVRLHFTELCHLRSADLSLQILFAARQAVLDHPDYDGYVLLTGTDSLEEVAFGLDLLLPAGKPFVVTGTTIPAHLPGHDGIANLIDAIRVLSVDLVRTLGVLVVLSANIHAARYVRKHDAQLPPAFASHPGPIGQIRRGRPMFYFTSLPPLQRFRHVALPDAPPPHIPILTMALDAALPTGFLQDVDGLVLAGMGTGSVPEALVDQLAPIWTDRIPIVISTRCAVGLNYDDYNYPGSLHRYESRGFRVHTYEGLSPVQARLKLLLECMQ